METLNIIGLETQQTIQLNEGLNRLLANFQLHYQNLRALHWNIKGKHFFELHAKFEEGYNDAQEKVDTVAERILTLGGTPLHSFSDYLERGDLQEATNIQDAEPAIRLLISSTQTLLILERELMESASELNDEGTVTMLSDFIAEQEKNVWMLNAWLQ